MSYIRKRKTRKGKTRWFIEIFYNGPDGERRRYRRDCEVQSRRGAELELERLLLQKAKTGTLEAPQKKAENPKPTRTINDAAVRYEKLGFQELKASTQHGYRVALDSFVRRLWGHVLLVDVTKAFLEEASVQLKNLVTSPSTRRNILVVLRRVLHSANTAEWLDHPIPLPKLPKVKATPSRAPRREEVEAIMAVSNPQLRLAMMVAADAGLRAGEIRGLQWGDIDLEAREITIRRAICRGVVDTPKSGCGRKVFMTDELHAALVAAKPKRVRKDSPVVPNTEGNIWSDSGLYVTFKAACRRAGIEGLRFHDLRHHFVTELFRHGAPAPVVKRQAGHLTLLTTQRYAGTSDDECRAYMQQVSKRRQEGKEV